MRRFRSRRGGGFRRARSFIRKTVVRMGPIEAKRVLVNDFDIPDITSAAFDNPVGLGLLQCPDDAGGIDETLVSDGTNMAQVPLYSKVVAIKLFCTIRGSVTTPGTIRWMLVKNTDNDRVASDWMSQFHTSDDTSTAREIRGLILAKGFIMLNESSGVSRLKVFVKRSTLKRLGGMRENDRIQLILANSNAPATNPDLSIMGTIYARLN